MRHFDWGTFLLVLMIAAILFTLYQYVWTR